LNGFEELAVDKRAFLAIGSYNACGIIPYARYFMMGGETGYCGLLIDSVKGSGLTGRIAAAAAKSYIGRTIYVFLSEVDAGKNYYSSCIV